MKKTISIMLLLVAFGLGRLGVAVQPAWAGKIDSAEAVAVAGWWLAQEISGDWSRVHEDRKGMLIDQLAYPSVRAIWRDGEKIECGELPTGRDGLALVVEFPEGGFLHPRHVVRAGRRRSHLLLVHVGGHDQVVL